MNSKLIVNGIELDLSENIAVPLNLSISDVKEPEAEEEEQSQDEVPAILKLKVNGEEVEKPLEEVVALAQQGLEKSPEPVPDEEKEIVKE